MIDFTISKNEHIQFIIDNFNFDKVHKVMEFLTWSWLGDIEAPTIEELKMCAIRLLNDVCDDDVETCSTGGFKATRYNDYLELTFMVSDYDSSILNYGDEYERRKKLKTRRNKINIINKK